MGNNFCTKAKDQKQDTNRDIKTNHIKENERHPPHIGPRQKYVAGSVRNCKENWTNRTFNTRILDFLSDECTKLIDLKEISLCNQGTNKNLFS